MNCYACGQSVSPGTPISDVFALGDVSSILGAVDRLSDLISSLSSTRIKLLQHLNEHRASTRVFSPEILSTIFRFASPPPRFSSFDYSECDEYRSIPEIHGQMTLGAVSWRWRQVILMTPGLWANTSIRICRQNARRKAKLIQLYLTRVGNMSLSLHLAPGPEASGTQSDLNPVFKAIWRGAHKFQLLSMLHIPISWILLPAERFTHLEGLRLRWSSDEIAGPISSCVRITSFPRLRHLYVWCTALHVPPRSLCESLTILRFVDVSLITCIKMLLACPNLVEYTCHLSQISTYRPDLFQFSGPMTFSHMKIFCTPFSTTALFSSILHNLHFPVLETLGLELGIETDGLEDLLSFITYLPTTWPILEISGHGYSNAMLRKIFECIPPHVRSLHLPRIDYQQLGHTLTVLDEFDDNDNPLILGLQKIRIDPSALGYRPTEDNDAPFNAQLLLDMICDREDHLMDGQFCLEIKPDDHDEINREDVQGELEEMAADGSKVKISIL